MNEPKDPEPTNIFEMGQKASEAEWYTHTKDVVGLDWKTQIAVDQV